MTKMPPLPAPPVSSSSPRPHEWTHRPPCRTICQSRIRARTLLCTIFSLTDSSTLEWHPIFTAVIERAEKLLRIRKGWTANPPARPDNQGATPMLPNDDNLVLVLVNMRRRWISLRLLKSFTLINQEREKRQQRQEKIDTNTTISHKHEMRWQIWEG